MKHFRPLTLLGLPAVLSLIVACGGPESKLRGVWKKEDKAIVHLLDFREQGVGYWIRENAGVMDTVAMNYVVDFNVNPHKLDLSGSGVAPFIHRSFYGIIEFEGRDRMKFQVQPGMPGQDGDTIRPKAFNETAAYYQKQ